MSKCKSLKYKTFRKKRCANLQDLKYGNGFLDITPKHEKKIDKWDFMKMKISLASKDTIRNTKQQPHRMRENKYKLYI